MRVVYWLSSCVTFHALYLLSSVFILFLACAAHCWFHVLYLPPPPPPQLHLSLSLSLSQQVTKVPRMHTCNPWPVLSAHDSPFLSVFSGAQVPSEMIILSLFLILALSPWSKTNRRPPSQERRTRRKELFRLGAEKATSSDCKTAVFSSQTTQRQWCSSSLEGRSDFLSPANHTSCKKQRENAATNLTKVVWVDARLVASAAMMTRSAPASQLVWRSTCTTRHEHSFWARASRIRYFLTNTPTPVNISITMSSPLQVEDHRNWLQREISPNHHALPEGHRVRPETVHQPERWPTCGTRPSSHGRKDRLGTTVVAPYPSSDGDVQQVNTGDSSGDGGEACCQEVQQNGSRFARIWGGLPPGLDTAGEEVFVKRERERERGGGGGGGGGVEAKGYTHTHTHTQIHRLAQENDKKMPVLKNTHPYL